MINAWSAICLVLAGNFLLTGCESLTPEQQEANRRYDEAKQREVQQQYIGKLRSQCQAFGYVQGSDAFARCVQDQDRASRAKDVADHEDTLRAIRAYNCNTGVQTSCDNQGAR